VRRDLSSIPKTDNHVWACGLCGDDRQSEAIKEYPNNTLVEGFRNAYCGVCSKKTVFRRKERKEDV
jgi:hypothetical protein